MWCRPFGPSQGRALKFYAESSAPAVHWRGPARYGACVVCRVSKTLVQQNHDLGKYQDIWNQRVDGIRQSVQPSVITTTLACSADVLVTGTGGHLSIGCVLQIACAVCQWRRLPYFTCRWWRTRQRRRRLG